MDSPQDFPTPSVLTCNKCHVKKPLDEFAQKPPPKPGENRHGHFKHDRKQPCKACIATTAAESTATRDLKKEIASRIEEYGYDALEALHDIAMMKCGKNSKLLQVKYMAANRLAPQAGMEGVGGTQMDGVLRLLNEQYQTAAPRIRSVRERTITFEERPAIEAELQQVTN